MVIDFLMISTRSTKRGAIEVYPKFIIKKSSDLMIRGGDFYAIWVEERGLWSTDEQDALQLIDRELDKYAEENRARFDSDLRVLHMWDAESGMIDSWHKYCQKQMRDSFHMLDERLIFSNTETNKKDYASKKLGYPLEAGDLSAYNKLMSTLYDEKERHKIEWAIGSIVSGESKKLQKFMVLYGAAGTGKSTVLNIVQQLFDGYYSTFDAKALGSSSNAFALESFRTNPLVAIQHDGDLSKIEDNTRLNSLVSHELMTVNEKYTKNYSNRFKCFLFMGTNKPVKITDAKSGLIRRLIDVSPSGNKLSAREYKTAVKQIEFELGAIAYHCQEIYLNAPAAYDDYIPMSMLGASNDFYNFVVDSYHVFKKEDGTTLKAAWEMYKTYCDEAKVIFPFSQRIFKEELRNYFKEYIERFNLEDGSRVRSYYSGFLTSKFDDRSDNATETVISEPAPTLVLESTVSIFDTECKDCPAQYASSKETPSKKWDNVKTTLQTIDTSRVHYVKVPENHIVIDLDLIGPDGKKSREKNLEEASKWPPTYAEFSKSGSAVHLHYIYSGDINKLSRVYDDRIEVKVFTGNSSLRRKLTKCNDLPIATINSGLPLKGDGKMVSFDGVRNEKGIRTSIKRNLNKEIHPATKPSIDFIYKILKDAYAEKVPYDVTDMRAAITAFAASSTNQADYCLKLVNKMQFKSEEPHSGKTDEEAPIIFYDIEVFPNLFLVCWKMRGEGKPIVRMFNPSPKEIEDLLRYRLVGFNNRRYDNHILYAGMLGYTNEQIYNLSQKIVSGGKNCFFGEAYNISYTDIYDFSVKKQSLKKWQIELGIHHQELGLPWDKPVPEELWEKVADYCDNDVLSEEVVFDHLKSDFVARQILADVAGMTVNDTTNTLTGRIIFGNDRKPQSKFNYRDMGEVPWDAANSVITKDMKLFDNLGDEYTLFDNQGKPVFPGYKYEFGKSTYRGEEVGEGGYVYAEPGMYTNTCILDVASMHPTSIIAEELFGREYTERFAEIVYSRLGIKHSEIDKIIDYLDGKLKKYLVGDEYTADELAGALKIAINSVYGLTSAKFENLFRDPRNKDNIVAKRGALFMINLKYEVQSRGFTVAHIKTDSIKIPDATPEIIQFVKDYGEMYGYTFEHEATYEKMCLVNDAVYIAKYDTEYSPAKKAGKWTATGTQFAVPYVFKTLFSREPVEFDDFCETKSVSTALYLDMNEELPNVESEEKEYQMLVKKHRDENGDFPFDIMDRLRELEKIVEAGHCRIFVGRVGQFCPIKSGCGGGLLLRETSDKGFAAATGSKGYRWLESEMVRQLDKTDCIDRLYYDALVDAAVEEISKYGDFEWFISDDDTPPWFGADEPLEAQLFNVR